MISCEVFLLELSPMLSMKSKDLTLFRLGGSNVPATPKVLSKLRKTTNIKKQKKAKLKISYNLL